LIRDNKISYGALIPGEGEREVIMCGKVYHEAETDAELPAVGDWVALDVSGEDAVIRARLPRRTRLSRKLPGRSTEEQVIATNVDIVVVVTEAGADFNLRRMERYFALIGLSGARAMVLVNKADLFSTAENEAAAAEIRSLKPDAEVFVTNAMKARSLAPLRAHLVPGVTMTFVGSSGVGKSSIINQLLGGDYQWTDDVNDVTGKGRHTTTARELMVLRKGGIIIDNPGIREVHMWTDETTLREQFADIEALAVQCKFSNCRHGTNLGCAVRAAVDAGTLPAARYEGFLKLDEEIARLRENRKKRQMTVDRRERREHRIKARKFTDRRNAASET
jgi:ribosome biogenesis GTPase